MEDMKHPAGIGLQYLAATLANILNFCNGAAIGWPSPMQLVLQDNTETSFWDSKVKGLSTSEFSWIGGIACLGGFVGTPIFGYLTNAIGRKKTLFIAGIPLVCSFFLIAIATNSIYLYVARVLAGLTGAGCLVVVPLYVGEISQDSARGVLGSFLNLFIGVGILASYVIGSYTSYVFLALFGLLSTIVFLISVMWIPESPVYLLINNRPEEAYSALIKLRGNHKELVQLEMNSINAQIKKSSSSGTMPVCEMLKDRATKKSLIIVIVLCSVLHSSGISPILAYSAAIFQAAGSSLSPAISAITIGALQIAGALIGTTLMDKAGRKTLLMISGVAMSLSLAPISYFLYLKNHDASDEVLSSIGWLPVTSLAVYIVVFGLGFGSVPFVLVSELFKNETKGAATSICMAHNWTMSFIFLKFFSNLSDALGIETCFALFSLCTAFGSLFTYFFVFETKGKSQEEIQQILDGKSIPTISEKQYDMIDKK